MKRQNDGPGRKRKSFSEYLKSSLTARMLLCMAGIAVILAVFVAAIIPARYNLQLGEPSPATIAATKDVVDENTTRKLQDEAAARETKYQDQDDEITEAVLADLDEIFTQLRSVIYYGDTLPGQSATRMYSKQEKQNARELLTLVTLNDPQITALLHSNAADLEKAYALTYQNLQLFMQQGVKEGKEAETVAAVYQVISYGNDFRTLTEWVIRPVLNACVRANILIDQEATEAARQAARDAVEPVIYKQGQVIVNRDEEITAGQLDMLSSLGLLTNGGLDMTTYLGAALLVILTMAAMLWRLKNLQQDQVLSDTDRTILMFVILTLVLLLSVLARLVNAYMAPMVLCALLCTALLGLRPALVCNTALTILVAALCAGGSDEYAEKMAVLMVCGLISGTVAALMTSRKAGRLWMLLSGLTAAATDAAVMIALGLMTAKSLNGALISAAWRVGGTLVGTLLCVGFQPLLEMIFNLATPMKLMELSNPNQPLLRRLLLEAPGTYHHSTIVASLAEAAAEAINANPLLARVGGYYHDIGKLKRPSFFAENQMGGINAHDHTDPYVSAAILTAHTRDGVAMAKQYRLPRAVQDIIGEHHGNTPVMFFYHKALQMADGKPVDINAFRYDGHPPRSKEGAIIMLCDTIEAAVRTMKNPTTEGIEEFIVKLVRGKLEDGQLSDSPLTLRDIDKICAAATQVLAGVFHERIEYPDLDEVKQQARQDQMEAAEMEMEREDAVTIVTPEGSKLPKVELAPREAMPTVTLEAAPEVRTVAPPPTVTPVAIDTLVNIEPLPKKEDGGQEEKP